MAEAAERPRGSFRQISRPFKREVERAKSLIAPLKANAIELVDQR